MRTHQNLPVDVDDGVVGIDGHQTIVGGVLDILSTNTSHAHTSQLTCRCR